MRVYSLASFFLMPRRDSLNIIDGPEEKSGLLAASQDLQGVARVKAGRI